MRRNDLLFVTAAVTWVLLLCSPLHGQTPSGQPDCPSCASFGVQRLSEKKEAPFFNLRRIDGTFVNLRDLRGKPAILFFWATWCPSCKEEIGLFEKFLKDKSDQLAIYTLVIDGESEKAVHRTIQKYTIGLPVLLDVKEKIARTYGVKMVPCTYLVSREGLMLGTVVGQRDWSSPEAWCAIREIFGLR
jgi:peroxiredoxin